MKNNLLTMTAMSFLGLAVSTSALANISPFYKTVGDTAYCGFKDTEGKTVIAANKYEGCGQVSDGMAYVGVKISGSNGDKWLQGFVDENGKIVIPVKYEVAEGLDGGEYQSFSEGLVAVYKNGKYGYMDKQQKLVIPHNYETAQHFNEGLAVVSNEGLSGVINKAGKVVVPLKHGFIGSYSDGVAAFTVDTNDGRLRYGFMDKKGSVTLKPKWNIAEGFSEGLAAVAIDPKGDESYRWGVINKSGHYVVQPKYHRMAEQTESSNAPQGARRYKNGKIFMYDYVNPNSPQKSKVVRYTLDKAGKVVNTKTFADWAAASKDNQR